jgi:hypothetical protein
MSDAAIQGYIQDLLQAEALFANANVTLGDYRVLDSGSSPYAVILPGRIVQARRAGDWSQVQFVWEHTIDVVARFLGDDYSDLTTARQTVVDAINENPTLGGKSGITGSHVSAATEPRYIRPKGQPDALPTFTFSRVTVRTVEDVLYAGGGEFA